MMDEEGQQMSQSVQQTTPAEPNITQPKVIDSIHPSAFNIVEAHDHSLSRGEDTSRKDHSHGGKAVAFSKENSNVEFNKLNQCIESSKNIGVISVDDAETLVFFLELVRETLTTRRFTNA